VIFLHEDPSSSESNANRHADNKRPTGINHSFWEACHCICLPLASPKTPVTSMSRMRASWCRGEHAKRLFSIDNMSNAAVFAAPASASVCPPCSQRTRMGCKCAGYSCFMDKRIIVDLSSVSLPHSWFGICGTLIKLCPCAL
jgi:hypothetical protein